MITYVFMTYKCKISTQIFLPNLSSCIKLLTGHHSSHQANTFKLFKTQLSVKNLFLLFFWKKDIYQQYKAPFSKLHFYSLVYRHQEDEDLVSWSVCEVLIATTWVIQLELAKVGAHYMFIKWWMNHLIEDEKIQILAVKF